VSVRRQRHSFSNRICTTSWLSTSHCNIYLFESLLLVNAHQSFIRLTLQQAASQIHIEPDKHAMQMDHVSMDVLNERSVLLRLQVLFSPRNSYTALKIRVPVYQEAMLFNPLLFTAVWRALATIQQMVAIHSR